MTAYYHLPGLFEFYELYRVFLPLFRAHREYFYDWCAIGSLYGAPEDCLWGGGRVGSGNADARDMLALTREYAVSARLTFSNSLLKKEHLADARCNALCRLFAEGGGGRRRAERRDRTLRFIAGLSAHTVSAALFCLLDHEGHNGLFAAPAGAGTGGISLCCAGFSPEQKI